MLENKPHIIYSNFIQTHYLKRSNITYNERYYTINNLYLLNFNFMRNVIYIYIELLNKYFFSTNSYYFNKIKNNI